MLKVFLSFPLFVLVMMISALAMFVPGIYAAAIGEITEMRAFGYNALLLGTLAGILGLAMMNRQPRITARSHLMTLLLIYLLMPAFLALPVLDAVPFLGNFQAYFEMSTALTTTGTFFGGGYHIGLAHSVVLWQAIVAWLGGLLTLVAALAILEPLSLGGFEIRTLVLGARSGSRMGQSSTEASERLVRVLLAVSPPYFLATFILAMLLTFAGSPAYYAAVHAMSVLSTSGFYVEGSGSTSMNFAGEVFIAFFLLIALSHQGLYFFRKPGSVLSLKDDPEIRSAFLLIGLATAGLFLHHWLASFDVDEGTNFQAALKAAWGAFFTSLSFLTTTGLESVFWEQARNWSGLDSPGIILLALAATGGGVATTAGGVKLMRIFALYKHGMRELQKVAHPSSVGGAGTAARRFRREGAYIAWMFLMLFILALGMFTVALTLGGLEFETALALGVASIANIGPAAHALTANSLSFVDYNGYVEFVLCLAMIFGRMEVLALIALMNPEYWRR